MTFHVRARFNELNRKLIQMHQDSANARGYNEVSFWWNDVNDPWLIIGVNEKGDIKVSKSRPIIIPTPKQKEAGV